jgi:hypothetical protein
VRVEVGLAHAADEVAEILERAGLLALGHDGARGHLADALDGAEAEAIALSLATGVSRCRTG